MPIVDIPDDPFRSSPVNAELAEVVGVLSPADLSLVGGVEPSYLVILEPKGLPEFGAGDEVRTRDPQLGNPFSLES